MQRILILFVCLFCFGNANSQDSSIDFIIRNLGINVDGHFNNFVINAELGEEGELKTITGKITVSSIETGIVSRDEHLLEKDYFHAEKYKYITLKTISINKNSINTYRVETNLTIKGKTKNIVIPITVEILNGNYKITSYFEINRKDFGVGGGSLVMSKTVKINVTHYQDI